MMHGEYFKDIVERLRGFNLTHFENILEISLGSIGDILRKYFVDPLKTF